MVPNITPIMENQMEKEKEHEMDTGVCTGVIVLPKLHELRTELRLGGTYRGMYGVLGGTY